MAADKFVIELKECEEDILEFFVAKDVPDPEKLFEEVLKDPVATSRLLGIVKGDIVALPGKSSVKKRFRSVFKEFCKVTPCWANCLASIDKMASRTKKRSLSEGMSSTESISSEGSCVFHDIGFWMPLKDQLDLSTTSRFKIDSFLVLRAQLSKSCYLHSVVAMEHYLLCIGTHCSDSSMIDLGDWVRDIQIHNAYELKQFLFNEGGSPLRALKNLCDLETEDFEKLPVNVKFSSHLYDAVKAGNPLLLEGFSVFNRFFEAGKFSYSSWDRVGDKEAGTLHSMLVIGARVTAEPDEGGYYFLLQNWWTTKFFVEVSAKYLALCQAVAVCVKKKL